MSVERWIETETLQTIRIHTIYLLTRMSVERWIETCFFGAGVSMTSSLLTRMSVERWIETKSLLKTYLNNLIY